MAWQVLLMKLPDALGSLAALPADYVPPPLGPAERVADQIAAVARGALLTVDQGERLVVMRSDELVIEAELGGVAPEGIDRVLLHVLGSDEALPLVGALAQALEAAAIDCETDTVLDADAIVPDTLRQWQIRIDDLR
jgi:hypothetical protein